MSKNIDNTDTHMTNLVDTRDMVEKYVDEIIGSVIFAHESSSPNNVSINTNENIEDNELVLASESESGLVLESSLASVLALELERILASELVSELVPVQEEIIEESKEELQSNNIITNNITHHKTVHFDDTNICQKKKVVSTECYWDEFVSQDSLSDISYEAKSTTISDGNKINSHAVSLRLENKEKIPNFLGYMLLSFVAGTLCGIYLCKRKL
jgi:hypothetical protein